MLKHILKATSIIHNGESMSYKNKIIIFEPASCQSLAWFIDIPEALEILFDG